MATDDQINHLVDEITRRVQSQMGQSTAREKECISFDPKDCDTCQGCHTKRTGPVRDLVQLGMSRFAAGIGHDSPPSDLAPLIDHTLLKPNATRDQLMQLCAEARKHGFATVCVNPVNVRFVRLNSKVPEYVLSRWLGSPLAQALRTRRPLRLAKQFETALKKSIW